MRVYKVEGWVGGPLKDKYGKPIFRSQFMALKSS